MTKIEFDYFKKMKTAVRRNLRENVLGKLKIQCKFNDFKQTILSNSFRAYAAYVYKIQTNVKKVNTFLWWLLS